MTAHHVLSDIVEKTYDIISVGLKVDRDKIVPQARFVDDLGADSLDQVELVMAIEEEFEVEIPESDAEKFLCVQDVLDYIHNKKIVN
ncbi:MAG: acyl carrier protein [Gammaproteobacteria bacterium]|nr:acyl carrier protein [Gammaproteobacteria bacterium]